MTSYSESKFSQLTLDRKVKVMLDLIYKIEEAWGEEKERNECLAEFFTYFRWTGFDELQNTILKRLGSSQFRDPKALELRDLLDLSVPMERFLEANVSDDKILILEGDRPLGNRQTYPLYFVLDHLRSSFNVGSIFRTADCLGVKHIFLVGYTPTPEDKGVCKTAMGAEGTVEWSQHNHMSEVIEILRSRAVEIIALETVEGSEPLDQISVKESMALVVGNERFGLRKRDIQLMDRCTHIPMMGVKNSLNVANSVSIAGFEVIRQWRK